MYKISYHRLVLSEDFKRIPKADQSRIIKIIDKKLSLSPKVFGKPLSGDLKGYYRLRIDPYRVIFKIVDKHVEVLVLNVGLRKDLLVYIQAAKRLKLI